MSLWLRVAIGAGIGLAGGGLLGYFGKCSSGGCPLTANPWRGAMVGLVVGVLVALALGPPRTRGGTRDALASLEAVTEEGFEDRVLRAEKPVVVDFYTDWCGYCADLAPTIAALAEEYRDRAAFVKVDGDRSPGLVRRYQVEGYPTVLIFSSGQLARRLAGARPAENYRAALDEVLSAKKGASDAAP